MNLRDTWKFLSEPPLSAPKATLALRLMAGGVFFWEGLLKLVYSNQGVGRFTKLGMPLPELLANAIALLEIGGGLLLMAGLLTRFISVPFIVEMIVAVLMTKVSLYLGTSPLPMPPAPPKVGFWGRAPRDPIDLGAQTATSVFPSPRAWAHGRSTRGSPAGRVCAQMKSTNPSRRRRGLTAS